MNASDVQCYRSSLAYWEEHAVQDARKTPCRVWTEQADWIFGEARGGSFLAGKEMQCKVKHFRLVCCVGGVPAGRNIFRLFTSTRRIWREQGLHLKKAPGTLLDTLDTMTSGAGRVWGAAWAHGGPLNSCPIASALLIQVSKASFRSLTLESWTHPSCLSQVHLPKWTVTVPALPSCSSHSHWKHAYLFPFQQILTKFSKFFLQKALFD